MKTICVTPTGDRPECLALSRHYLERAKAYYVERTNDELEWLVVDDGVKAYNPGGCQYLRRKPDGPNSLGRNLRYAFENGGLDCDHVLIWEDDDWYAPTRIHNQVRQLCRFPLYGYSCSVYYNVELKGVFQHENHLHSSLFESAMQRETAQGFNEIINQNLNQPFLDLILWRQFRGRLDRHCGEAIGMKGMPGRSGLGAGHKKDVLTYVPANLKDLIGEEDAKRYDLQGTARIPQIGRKDSADQS